MFLNGSHANRNSEIINMFSIFLSIYMKNETEFPHNTQWSRLTDWLGLNLIQHLDRHILEAYHSLQISEEQSLHVFSWICLINWLVKSTKSTMITFLCVS